MVPVSAPPKALSRDENRASKVLLNITVLLKTFLERGYWVSSYTKVDRFRSKPMFVHITATCTSCFHLRAVC